MTDHHFRSFAPIPTPLDPEELFDGDALRAHLGWLEASGLGGALVLGTNGEFPSLSLDERLRVAEAAMEAGTCLEMMLGVGSCSLTEVEAMIGAAARLGYDMVLCPPPFYFRSAPLAGVARYFMRVLDGSSLPVLLYNIPRLTGIPIDDRLLDAIGDHGHLAGVKDSSGDPEELRRLAKRFASGAYYVGSDHLVRDCLEAGGSGSITAAANVAPALLASMRSAPEGQAMLSELRRLLEEFGLGPAVKSILRSRGLGEYRTRPPLVGLSADRERELLTRVAELAWQEPEATTVVG
jgi:dihydrodipicolinate synthase/N-acetylneuraminate lyase